MQTIQIYSENAIKLGSNLFSKEIIMYAEKFGKMLNMKFVMNYCQIVD